MKKLYLCLLRLLSIYGFSFAQEVSDFEDIEGLTRQDFFKTIFKGFFTDVNQGDPLSINGGVDLNARTYSVGDRKPTRAFFSASQYQTQVWLPDQCRAPRNLSLVEPNLPNFHHWGWDSIELYDEIEVWMRFYNHERSHESLKDKYPVELFHVKQIEYGKNKL